jgi:hypothetical protein
MVLPRMTVQRWMLVVAVIALGLVPMELLHRSYIYVQKAESYERRAEGASIRRKAEDKFGIFSPEMFDANGQMTAEHAMIFEMLRAHFGQLGRKYRHAASHPWQAVEPDPPIPGQQ